MANIDHVSLLSGPLPITLDVAAFVVLAASVHARARPARDVVLAVSSLAVVVVIGWAIGIEHRVGSSFPRSFFVWAALPVFAGVIAATRWAQASWPRRVVSLLSIALVAGFAAQCVNAQYAYLPTIGDAIGRPVADQMPLSRVGANPDGEPASDSAPTTLVVAHGVAVTLAIPGTASGFHARKAVVWLPPAYFARPRPELSAIIMLAGVPGDPSNLVRAGGALGVADDYAAAHGGLAPVLVMPDHNGAFLRDTECVNGPRGRVETYLMVDVRGFVESHFGVSSDSSAWGIVGYSEGGTCAVTLALRHPETFAAFVDIAGDLRPNAARGRDQRRLTVARLYRGDAREWLRHDPLTLLRAGLSSRPKAIFIAGRNDHHAMHVSAALATAARHAGLDTTTKFLPGGHSFATVQRALVIFLPRLADQLRTSAAPTAT